MEKPSVEMSSKDFANAVQDLIMTELKAIIGDGRKELTACEHKMVESLNRVSSGVNKIRFRGKA